MADTNTLWREAKGLYQDAGRDAVPPGHVWDMRDFVPEILGAPVAMRGAWLYQSDILPAIVDGMLYAPYKAGGKLLAANGTNLRDISTTAITSTSIGTIAATKQNPVFHRDRVIIPASNGTSAAKGVTLAGAVFTLTDLPASALTGKYATVFKDRTLIGASNANPQQIAFSKPGDPTLAWDSTSLINTSLALTGLASQRNQILCFHDGSVERLRGTTPPDSSATDPLGDMTLDSLFDRAGCFDARSIAYWNDNVIFADARGVHLTDGAIVRNMAAQGGVESLWRFIFHEDTTRGAVVTTAGGVHRDFYLVTIRSTSGDPITFVCHIPTRRWWRFGNIDSSAFAFSVGVGEKIYATHAATLRVTDLSPAFSPNKTINQVDANAVNVLPFLEGGWQRLGVREGLKRIVDVLVSYVCSEATPSGNAVLTWSYLGQPTDTTYETIGVVKQSATYIRRKLRLGRRLYGIAFKVEQTLPTKQTLLYDISTWKWDEEQTRL